MPGHLIDKAEYFLLKDSRQKLDEAMNQVADLVSERKKYAFVAKSLKEKLKSDNSAAVETLEILSSIIIKNDSFYCRKVASLAKAAAEEFNLEPNKLKIVETLSRLHLSGLLFAENKTDELMFYPGKAVFLIEKFSELKKISSVFKDLDECFDGSGPNSKTGKKISLEIRIVRAAAFYYNFYYKNFTVGQILEKLNFLSGKALDPNCVSVVFRLLDKKDLFSELKIRAVNVKKLEPGMILKSALFSKRGAMLLPSGTKLDQKLIDKIVSFDLTESVADTILINIK
jgi:response regulator RpfG family c-di-GMP phosphodiesterase